MNLQKREKVTGNLFLLLFFSSIDVYEGRNFSCTTNAMGLSIMLWSSKGTNLKFIQYSKFPSLDNLKSVTYRLIIACTLQLACNI